MLDYRVTGPEDLALFDVILDTSGSALESFRRRLGPGGRIVMVNFGSAGAMLSIALSTLFGSRRVRTFSANPTRRELDAITPYVQDGILRPDIGEIFPLDAIAAAHAAFQAKVGHGKVVLIP